MASGGQQRCQQIGAGELSVEFFKIRRDIPFMRHALVLNVVSLVTFLLAVFFLFSRGLHLSVEFTGGTVMEVGYAQAADVAKVRGVIAGLGYTDIQVQNFGTNCRAERLTATLGT